MVWVITIATFLGTMVAVLLMLFILSQRRQIREVIKEHRTEKRIPAKGDLGLSSLGEPLIHDQALIKNASRHGARVVGKKPWRPNDQLLVKLPQCNTPSRARIAYCNALRGDAFAIGLQFFSVAGEPEKSTWDLSNIELLSHPYRK